MKNEQNTEKMVKIPGVSIPEYKLWHAFYTSISLGLTIWFARTWWPSVFDRLKALRPGYVQPSDSQIVGAAILAYLLISITVIYITSVCKSTRLKHHKKPGLIKETKESSASAVIIGFAFWLISGFTFGGFILGIVIGLIIGLLFIFMRGFSNEFD